MYNCVSVMKKKKVMFIRISLNEFLAGFDFSKVQKVFQSVAVRVSDSGAGLNQLMSYSTTKSSFYSRCKN